MLEAPLFFVSYFQTEAAQNRMNCIVASNSSSSGSSFINEKNLIAPERIGAKSYISVLGCDDFGEPLELSQEMVGLLKVSRVDVYPDENNHVSKKGGHNIDVSAAKWLLKSSSFVPHPPYRLSMHL
jgi:hypothetical protein